jgi:hypothetical protein
MRKLLTGGFTLGLGIALSVPAAAAASGNSTIVVSPGQSIQAAINQAVPGDTVLVRPGVYKQAVQIRTDGITLRGSGDFLGGTVIKPPAATHNLCSSRHLFGPTGVCILAKKVNMKTGAVITPVYNDTVTNLYVTGFASNGVFGYGTYGLTVQRVVATDDGDYGISRFESTNTLFANDTAIGNDEAGFYVGDSPNAATVVRNDVAKGNEFGIFVRHARGVTVMNNRAKGNCQGILVLDDGEQGGAGNAVIQDNSVYRNNRFCPADKEEGAPPLQGGGILLVGATQTKVLSNSLKGNSGKQFNSGGIVVVSAGVFGGSDPMFDTIARNTAFRDKPADLRWDGTGNNITFVGNHCTTSIPAGNCH